jgi:hypothetical protein
VIHLKGILLFLFIPLVLYLFLQYPAGLLPSFVVAIVLMLGHRFIARPFFLRNKNFRCFWCGRTGKNREKLEVRSGKARIEIEACIQPCSAHAQSFFAFTYKYRALLRLGIFVPLLWYIVTMLLDDFGVWSFPRDWNRFIFQFFIALTVVTISFSYRSTKQTVELVFPFPIHNLFLLGAKNTLLVFRYVGIWWIAASLWFLWKSHLMRNL